MIKTLMRAAGSVLVLFAACFPIDASEIVVEYMYKGQPYTTYGVKTGLHEYVFNKGGDKQITITTLDWPPYIAEFMCGQGWVQQVVVAIFASQGYEVRSQFYPWKRAVKTVEQGLSDALYPEYFIPKDSPSDFFPGKKRRELLGLSEGFQGGPLAFWKRSTMPFRFDGNLETLKGRRIGVVAGYENSPEFDRLAEQGYFTIDPATDDLINLKKLYNGRVDLIVGDPNVFELTIKQAVALERGGLTLEEAETYLRTLETVYPVIEEKFLYLAFSKKSPQYEEHLKVFNRVLKEFQEAGEIDRLREVFESRYHLEQDCLTTRW